MITPADCDVTCVCTYMMLSATIKNATQRYIFKKAMILKKCPLKTHKNGILRKVQATDRKAGKIENNSDRKQKIKWQT